MGPFAGVLIEFFCKDYNAQRPTEPNQYYFPIKAGAKNSLILFRFCPTGNLVYKQ